MANPEHVELVRQGAKAIHEWRKKNRGVQLDLSGAQLIEADLSMSDLSEAVFSWADLSGADLSGADLSGADLSRANLSWTNLSNADLSNADLYQADLAVATFKLTKLSGADLSEAYISNTVFANVDLSSVIGLDSVDSASPSTIGVDTLYKSRGQIPEVFLRGCGVPENLVTFLHSLTGNAFEFYTCFISFTEKDDEFSKRLYNDLQGEGVRCWRWKEDAKWGTSLMREVDQAVRFYDKLVIILSEHSLKSEPVVREIDRALQKEQRDNKEVLFPIRLDDAVFSWDHELQPDVVRKNVGDFREWEKAESYQQSFKRLVESLKAPPKEMTAKMS